MTGLGRLAVATAVAAASWIAGCATAPKHDRLGPEEWAALAPLQLEFRVLKPSALLPYKPMGESATLGAMASSGEGALLVILTLPIWLAVDGGRKLAEGAREAHAGRGNRELEDRWAAVLDEAAFRQAFMQGTAAALKNVALVEGAAPPEQGHLLNDSALGANMRFALRSDARALLVEVTLRLPDLPPTFKCKGPFQCSDMQSRLGEPRFAARFLIHSEVLPEIPAAELHGADALVRYASMWVENDGLRLRQAFAESAVSLSRLTRLALVGDAIGDGLEEGGRRVRRSKDGAWLDLPAAGRYREALEELPRTFETVYP